MSNLLRLAAGYLLGVARPLAVVAVLVNSHAVLAQQLGSFVNALQIPGETTDRHPGSGANVSRLGAFCSDLWYDQKKKVFFGLVDRGPGGGKIPFDMRIELFTLKVDYQSGAIGNFRLLDTLLLRDARGAQALDGRRPPKSDQLENRFDAEGLVVGPRGNLYVADEYGPSIYEFSRVPWRPSPGLLALRAFKTPTNLIPRDKLGHVNYLAAPDEDHEDKPRLVAGRAPNRGLEGLAISPSGTKLYGVLQSPLVQEGGDGEHGRYVRIVEFDAAGGKSSRQFAYELESVVEINERIAEEQAHFEREKRGRATGISAILAINDHEFLVLERDNRGIGIDNSNNEHEVLKHVGSKRIYKIDIGKASDVGDVVLKDGELPDSVRAVEKTLFLDLQQAIEAEGLTVPEKIEGVAIGPRLKDGSYLLLVGTDNDFSVTQTKDDVQHDVYTDGSRGPIDGDAAGRTLLPTWLYAFKVFLPSYTRK